MLEIGKNVVITEDVKILTHGFDWSVLKIKYGSILGSAGKVSIGNNVFIGTGTIILKGVTIGDNSIIGAGSVVTHDIPANSVSVGNPCIPIYSLSEYKEKREKAQKEELFELIEAYIKAYKKRPNPNDLNEFFYLFEKRTLDQINESFIKKMKYGSEVSFQKSKDVFLNSTPIFDGLDDLVDKCIKERKIILK